MNKNSNVVRLRHPDEIDDSLTNILRSGAHHLLAQAIELEAEAFLAKMKGFKLADGRDRVVRQGRSVITQSQDATGLCACNTDSKDLRPLPQSCARPQSFSGPTRPRPGRKERIASADLVHRPTAVA